MVSNEMAGQVECGSGHMNLFKYYKNRSYFSGAIEIDKVRDKRGRDVCR